MNKITFCIIIFLLGLRSSMPAQVNMGSYEDMSSQIMASAEESDIICLGEESHGDMKALETKARILGEVVNHVPTGAILFEAPLVASVITYIRHESYSEFVWPFWRYEGLKTTLDDIIDTHGMICLGFDPQETCDFSRFSSFLISEGYLENEVELSKMDSILSICISDGSSTEVRKLTDVEAEMTNDIIEEIKRELHWPSGISNTEKALISLCFENRKHLAKEMTFQKLNDQMNFRDSIMALNVKHITEILKSELEKRKTIIWAANLHIANKVKRGTWMMERFVDDNDEKVISIGVIPRRRIIKGKRFDFAVVSGRPNYMSNKVLQNYDCE